MFASHPDPANASRLRGRLVASTAPTAGRVLTWNSGSSQWEPAAVPASPTTTRGDLIVRGVGADQRLALGPSGQYVRSNGTDAGWANIPSTDVTGLPWSDRISPSTAQTTDAAGITLKSYTTTTNKGTAFDLVVNATQSDRSASVTWKILASVTNVSGTVTIRNQLISPDDGGMSPWSVMLDVSGTDVHVLIAGANGTTIDWIVAGTILVHGS